MMGNNVPEKTAQLQDGNASNCSPAVNLHRHDKSLPLTQCRANQRRTNRSKSSGSTMLPYEKVPKNHPRST